MNKLCLTTILYLFFSSFIFSNEIWEKPVPPSHYLQSYALKNQESSSKGLKYLSYGSFIGGIILGNVHTYTEAQIGAVLITIGGLIGIIYDFTNNHETIAFKEYKKIKSINNVDEKEKLAYQSLVFLAEKSIQKRNNKDREKQNTSGLNPLTAIVAELFKMKLKEMKALTPEQKLLNNYLEQKPL